MTAPEPTGITDRTVELWTAGQKLTRQGDRMSRYFANDRELHDTIYVVKVAFWDDSTAVHVNGGWEPIPTSKGTSWIADDPHNGGMPIYCSLGYGTDEALVLWNGIRSAEWHFERMLGRKPGPWVPTSTATITHDAAPADPWAGQPYEAIR